MNEKWYHGRGPTTDIVQATSKQYLHFQFKHLSLPFPFFIISFEIPFIIIEQGIKMNLGRWWDCKE
jgi:hypothetical protein